MRKEQVQKGVLFLTSNANLHGGTEILAFNLVHELNAKGCACWLMSQNRYEGNDPHVIAMSNAVQRVYDFVENLSLDKILGSYFSDMILRWQMRRIAAKLGCEWIVSHTYDLVAALPMAGFKTAQVFNWSIKGYEGSICRVIETKKGFRRWLAFVSFKMRARRWHSALARIDKLVMLSNAAAQETREHFRNVDSRRLVVVPDPILARESAKKVSSLKNKQVVFVGRLSPEKGVFRLLRIWERINAQLPDYKLAIYGDGHLLEELKAKIEVEEWKDTVLIKGFERDLEKIYTGSDLLLMTSDTEGFGMVLIEAMYYGVPCVSFDCPVSPKEIIGAAGLTVPCFDEETYATEVVKFLTDGKRLASCQRTAIVRAKDFYIDSVLEQWRKWFF